MVDAHFPPRGLPLLVKRAVGSLLVGFAGAFRRAELRSVPRAVPFGLIGQVPSAGRQGKARAFVLNRSAGGSERVRPMSED